MKNFQILLSIVLFLSFQQISIHSQTEAINSVQYNQITSFESDPAIYNMKISADGSKIVYSTAGPFVKVFTLNSDGTGLTEVYDFQRTGFGAMVDISANGSKIIWCIGEGEIFIANADGSARVELATLLPNPNPAAAALEPKIPLPPRISPDGDKVYFINMDRDPLISGAWSVNADGSGLAQIFYYNEMASQVFSTDASEYNRNTAFTDGFDVSADGSKILFGTRIFKLIEGDLSRGHAILYNNGDFANYGEFALGNQALSISHDGGFCIMFKLELNAATQANEINVYFVDFSNGEAFKVLSSIDQFGGPAYTQMSSNGSTGIIHAANGRQPITLIDRVSGSALDLVSIDGASLEMGGFRMSGSYLPSITQNGDRFCFVSTTIPSQIWVADIGTDAIYFQPSISQVFLDPNFVLHDVSTTSTFIANVVDPPNTILSVNFEAFRDGLLQFRSLTSDFPSGYLFDDGNFGDPNAGDGFYFNNTVRRDLPETQIGEYTVRIAAASSTQRHLSMVDVGPFFITDDPVSVEDESISPNELNVAQNYPNPFNPSTVIEFTIPNVDVPRGVEGQQATLLVYDTLGRLVATLINNPLPAGTHKVVFDARSINRRIPSGVYFYQVSWNTNSIIKKMLLLK